MRSLIRGLVGELQKPSQRRDQKLGTIRMRWFTDDEGVLQITFSSQNFFLTVNPSARGNGLTVNVYQPE